MSTGSGIVHRCVVLAVCVLAGAGCYAYSPADPGQVRPNAEVRAWLSPSQAAELDPAFLSGGRTLEGRVLENGEDVLIQVPVASQLHGARIETLHQRLRIPHDGIVELQLRSLDRTRTGLVVGGGLAVLAGLVIRQLSRQTGGDSRRPGPNPPQEASIPILRLQPGFGR